jgi:hypothetical protein
MEELRAKYQDRDVAFVSMYVREPHPEERGFPQYTQHATYEQKMAYARELLDLKDVHIPVVVDGIDQHYHEDLGNLPNMAYVVDRKGRVRYHRTWLIPDEIDEVLATLVTADDPTRPVRPTIDTTAIGPAI